MQAGADRSLPSHDIGRKELLSYPTFRTTPTTTPSTLAFFT